MGLNLPTLHVIGEDDNVNAGSLAGGDLYPLTIKDLAERRRANGGLTAIAVQRDTGHTRWDGRTPFDLSFMLDWMSAVADKRVPQSIVPGTPYSLNSIDEQSGYLGELDLLFADSPPFITVTSATVGPFAQPDARQKWWLPDEAIATAWRDYNATGAYAPIPEPANAFVLPASALLLRRRRCASGTVR